MALLPPFTLDAVVAIGRENPDGSNSWIGTGFLYGKKPQKDAEGYRIWLVTNKHVLEGLTDVIVKFNSIDGDDSSNYHLPLVDSDKNKKWFGHPDAAVDVAALFINGNALEREKRKFNFFAEDSHSADREKLRSLGVTEGDRLFVLGFPMGIVSELRQYVFCRSGVFARIRDFIEGHSKSYIADIMVFPGNSGGPAIICPSALAIQGTKMIPSADLIGIVKSYIPYRDTAASTQSGRTRIVFEENSGLTLIESVDSIKETVVVAEQSVVPKEQQLEVKEEEMKDEQGDGANEVSRRETS